MKKIKWESLIMVSYVLCVVLAFGASFRSYFREQPFKDGREIGSEKLLEPVKDVKEAASMVSAQIEAETENPKIAITFDDGPNGTFTPILLDGLKERDVKAAFFLIGRNAEEYPEVVKRMDEEGHLIGNHTYHHVKLTGISGEEAYREIADTNQVIYKITGKETEYMRPPFGAYKRELEKKLSVFPVMWTVDPLDWTTENTDEIVNKVVTEAEEGDIILLHDCYRSSVDAALRIIDILKEQGFEFVTVDELMTDF